MDNLLIELDLLIDSINSQVDMGGCCSYDDGYNDALLQMSDILMGLIEQYL